MQSSTRVPNPKQPLTDEELHLLVVATKNWVIKETLAIVGEHLAPTSLGSYTKMHNVYAYEVEQ